MTARFAREDLQGNISYMCSVVFTVCVWGGVGGVWVDCKCVCACVFPPSAPSGTVTVCLSADHRGSCVGVEAVEIPSFIVVCVCACVRSDSRLAFECRFARPIRGGERTQRAGSQVFSGWQLTCTFPSFKNKQGCWGATDAKTFA